MATSGRAYVLEAIYGDGKVSFFIARHDELELSDPQRAEGVAPDMLVAGFLSAAGLTLREGQSDRPRGRYCRLVSSQLDSIFDELKRLASKIRGEEAAEQLVQQLRPQVRRVETQLNFAKAISSTPRRMG